MREGIHPEYYQATVTCNCGNTFVTGSTKKDIHVEVCSKCHSFYTGQQKATQARGRIDKFNKYNEIYKIPLKSVANNLSKGQKMRLNIMLEMSKGAEYIIMDEPASGLDPIAKTQFFDMLIREVEENGTGIFISSHNLQSLEKICDVVTVMHQGKIESNVAVNELKSKIKRVQAVFEKGVSDEDLVNAGFEHVSHTGSIYTMNSKEEDESIKEKLKSLGASFIEVTDLSLEEYFVALGDKN